MDMESATRDLLPGIDSLLARVYEQSKLDFQEYRRGTVVRRLERRLRASGSRNCLEYMDFLDSHPDEYRRLAEELTIKVSGFFRSPYSCQKVTGYVLPELLRYKESTGDRRLKFWSAACARGEEPYSIAIMLAEFLGERRRDFAVTIYATDISPSALAAAQAGRYSPDELAGLPPAMLPKYFTPCPKDGYEISPDIRRMVRFSEFDLTSSSPPGFAGVDGILCCNVLIYFQKRLQERVLNMLYESLAVPGYLILGEVETPTVNLSSKLDCLDGKASIYKKQTMTQGDCR
ncbi:MAG: protein-glutamate O-methyltransferase CheR [Dehalococcoidales bacterium]|nr:protein-glutamate O-methyltransferase CheR [Dehalococcoidales bacterium]